MSSPVQRHSDRFVQARLQARTCVQLRQSWSASRQLMTICLPYCPAHEDRSSVSASKSASSHGHSNAHLLLVLVDDRNSIIERVGVYDRQDRTKDLLPSS